MYFNLALFSRLVSTSEFWELRVADLLILSAFFGLKHARLYHLPRCGMELHHCGSHPVPDVGAEELEIPPVFIVVYHISLSDYSILKTLLTNNTH